MSNNTITWAAGNGAEIKITVGEYLDSAIAYASVAGKRELMSNPAMLKAPAKVGDKIIVASIGKVGLTQERLDQVRAMMAAVQAEIDARPEAQMRKLITQRERLAAAIGYILDAAHEAHVRFIERASANGFAKHPARDFASEEQAARAALSEFDAAHPDVVATVAANKAAATARFLAAD